MMRPSNWLLEFYLDRSSTCHPYRVVSCESGATWCADGKVHWRKDGEP